MPSARPGIARWGHLILRARRADRPLGLALTTRRTTCVNSSHSITTDRPVSRLLLVASIFLACLVAGLSVVVYFAYVIESGPPHAAKLAGLDHQVTVRWAPSEIASVEAAGTHDAMAGLGYAQASRRTWPLLLYRAAALGDLFDLIGDEALEADLTAIRLGLADGARGAFEALASDQKQLLTSFATGVNAALSDHRVLREPALLLSRVKPEPWEPWHSIAIERLFAWLGAEADSASSELQRRPLREALRLHDFDHSTIVASLPPLERGLYVRYVLGSSSLPVLFEVNVSGLFAHDVQGACLIGTPFFLAGRTEDRAWAFLPRSRYRLRTVTRDNSLKIERKRLGVVGGTERLVTILTDSLGVVLEEIEQDQVILSDTRQRIVSWSGLGATSDVTFWLDVTSVPSSGLVLFDGSGIVLSLDQRLYAGPDMRRSFHFSYMGESVWSRSAMERLDSLASESQGFYPRLWFLDAYSPWARRTAQLLVAALDSVEAERVPDAATYLRNWEYDYSRASIAASVFSVWAEITRDNEGAWPGLPAVVGTDAAADTSRRLASRSERWTNYLDLAVSRLTSDFGTDMSTWRWERVNAGELRFPLLGRPGRARAPFVPTVVSGFGHPSSPSWGPPEVYMLGKPLSVWEGWTRTDAADAWQVRRVLPGSSAGFSGSARPGELRHLDSVGSLQTGPSETTTLVPEE